MVNLSAQDWNLKNIECILFDKDGTLLDSDIYWGRIIERRSLALISAYELSFDRYEDLCMCMGYSIKTKKLQSKGPIAIVGRTEVIDIVSKYLNSQNRRVRDSDISEIFLKEHSLFNKELKKYLKIIPGTLDFINKVRQLGVKTAIVTSDTALNTNTFLNSCEISNLFDFVVGNETIKESKETGVPALYAMDKLNTFPDRTIAIGDTPVDILMSKKAKLKGCIGVATGQLSIETLRMYSAFTCNELSEIDIG